jgi:hypothetical protein
MTVGGSASKGLSSQSSTHYLVPGTIAVDNKADRGL